MFVVAILMLGLGAAPQVGLPTSGCEECHLVLHAGPSGPHVTQWATSEHAARRVGCVRCHDGNAVSDDILEAHRFVRPATVHTSPVNGRQLPATCGQCHPREATRFMSSRHGALLASNDAGAPSCASCHDAMSARAPTPSALQAGCANCHLDDPGHEQFPSDARVLTEWLASARERLAKVALGISTQADDVTRRQMWVTYDHAERCLRDAVGAMHGFDLTEAASLLSAARVDIRELEKRFGT